jgi:hypothetical protein
MPHGICDGAATGEKSAGGAIAAGAMILFIRLPKMLDQAA